MGFLDRFRANRPAALPLSGLQAAASALQTWPQASPSGTPHFAVIDVETTGLSPDQHRILEIAVVTTDPWGRVVDEWATRINPQGPVGATHVHGITDTDVANAPLFADLITQLNNRLAGAAIAAHHARFDLAFLRAEYARAGWDMPYLPALCTLQASEYHLPMLDRRRLADCCWAIGTPLTDAHSALGDARATATLLAAFMHPHVGNPPLPEHLDMPAKALTVAWPTGPARAATQVIASLPRRDLTSRAYVVMERQAAAPPPQALVELVEQFSLIDALDEGAPTGALAYLEKLAEVFEDGEVTADEAADLAALAGAEQLTNADVTAAHLAFVFALAHAALEDGKVTRAERAELQHVADLLGVRPKVIPALLDRAENARNHRMSADLAVLPADWPYGEPLRVGDKVVFTGCDNMLRNELELRSEQFGVRIVGGVSAKTALLVTDGTMDGTKAAKAREMGTRSVHPDIYAALLAHLQPALSRQARVVAKTRPVTAPGHTAVDPTQPATDERTTRELAPTGPDPAAVRVWARTNGFEVGTRGRLHADLIAAYLAADCSD